MTTRRARIREIVTNLLKDAHITEPPVPIEKLIRAQGIDVVKKRLADDTSGFVYVDPETQSATIGLNVSHTKTRQRFTLAHELGHYCLHKSSNGGLHVDDRDFFVRFRDPHSADGSDKEEREANTFAAELLMPSQFLRADIDTVGEELSISSDETFLAELAARYGVSRQALSFRLINLGLIDMAAFH